MNKLYILTILSVFILGTASSNEGEDHSGHEHKEQIHAHDSLYEKSDHTEHNHAEEHGHDHGGGKAIGKGKAIEVVDITNGFKLSKEAIKTLKLELRIINSNKFTIAKKTLVASKGIKGIYRFRNGFFKFLPVKIQKEVKGKYIVKIEGTQFGDQIVTSGVGLLRVSDVYSTDKSEYGHSH